MVRPDSSPQGRAEKPQLLASRPFRFPCRGRQGGALSLRTRPDPGAQAFDPRSLLMIQAARRPTLVVVGTGMAGAKVVEEVLARAPDRFHIRMFGAEPHGTYNRILLSSVLGGFQDPTRLWLNPLEWYERRGVFVHAGV